MDRLAPLLGNGKPTWTAGVPLPGGDMPNADANAYLAASQLRHPWLPAALLQRYVKTYGTRLHTLIGSARSLAELGAEILPGVYEAELRYLVDQEWALSADDILWRRSKLRLHLPANASTVLDAWLAQYRKAAPSARPVPDTASAQPH